MSQVARTRKPKKVSEVVDCEKTQRTGVNPRSKLAMRASEPAMPWMISFIPRDVPVRAGKM